MNTAHPARGRRLLASLAAVVLLVGLVTGFAVYRATAQTPVRVMPLGDSLTYGYPDTGGYRVGLDRMVLQAGMSVDFVGSLHDGPPGLADQDHEGHGGWRIDQLTPHVDEWMAAAEPDVVLLHIGTNDIADKYQMETAPERLRTLVQTICRARPGVRVVLASVGASDVTWDVLTDYNGAMPRLVADAQREGCHARFLDMNKVMVQADFPDGAHPTVEGYAKMADAWFPVLRSTYDEVRQAPRV